MQDNYYTLGVSPDSSADEIKAAYKKLAPKFHPDKNGNDPFFTERFKEIQHAYETLADTKKRQEYNLKREKPKGQSQTHYGNNFTPEIDYFRASSPYFEYDTEITFSWKTINADRVTIKPFGNVPPIGQKTVKFKDFKIPELTFDLLAENSTINRHVAKNLTIYNKTYRELSNHFTTNLDRHTRINNQTHHESPNTGKKDLLQIVLISIALILFFIAIIILNSEVR